MPLALIRFFKYSIVGVSTFALDLVLLYILADVLSMNHVIAAGISFTGAISLNYVLSRKYVFKKSLRSAERGYANFVIIALCGLVLVLGGMYVCVTVLGFNYLLSRVGIAIVTGFWNYLLNLYVNFQVAGK